MIGVYGEGLVDLVPTAPEPLAPLAPALGGGPFNAAIAAARLGSDVQFHSRISTDGFGGQLVASLVEAGVDVSALQRGDEPTTLAVTNLGPDGSAGYSFYVDGTADRFCEPSAPRLDVAAFGTLSLALEPAASRYATVMRELWQAGTLTVLDPNIRELTDTDEHRARLNGLLDCVDVLKLSEDEIAFFGDRSAFADIPVVVTTCGGDGLRIDAAGSRIDIPARKVSVADTIGAGDTILGAIISRIDGVGRADLPGLDWRAIGEFAVTAASITVSRRGAQPPTAEEVAAVAGAGGVGGVGGSAPR